MRLFDVLVSGSVLVISAPIWLVTSIVIKRDSPGPVLYSSQRIGRDGVPFRMLKFRTMFADAAGAEVTAGDDPRITRSGQWLRASKIDELPQLVNVLRGDMSLVGPRPEAPRYVQKYTPEQRRVLSVRPGITSPATVQYRDEERLLEGLGPDLEAHYLSQVLPAKLSIELEYLERQSFASDLRLLASTAWAIVRRSSSSSD